MIVIDASALVEMLVGSELGEAIEDRVLAKDQTLHAPHLVDLEVANALRRQVAMGGVSDVEADVAIERLRATPVHRYEHDLLLPRIWDLRHSLTAYDASYVVLAEALELPLVTCDARMARAGAEHVETELHRLS